MRRIRALLGAVVVGVTLWTSPAAAQDVAGQHPREMARRHWHHGQRHEFRHHRYRMEHRWGRHHRDAQRHSRRHQRWHHRARGRGEI